MQSWPCFAETSWTLQPWPRGQVLEAEPGLQLRLAAQGPSPLSAAWAALQEGPGFGVAGLEERGDTEEGVGQEVCPIVTCHSWRTAGMEGGWRGTAGRDPGEPGGLGGPRGGCRRDHGASHRVWICLICLSLTMFF